MSTGFNHVDFEPLELEIRDAEYLAYQRTLLAYAGVDAKPALPLSRHALVGGLRLHYLEWEGDGAPIIFLHGRAQTAHSWELLCLALRNECRCIAVDQRGHGLSEWSPGMDYRSSTVARDLAALMDRLELPSFTLVGFSMGGGNALAFASIHPERVERLIIFEAVLSTARRPGVQRIREFLGGEAEFPTFEALVDRVLTFNSGRHVDLLKFALQWNVVKLPNGNWTWRDDRRHRLHDDIWRAMLADRIRFTSQLHRITCPTLFIRGDKSDLVSEEAAAEVMSAFGGPVAYAEVSGMGHAIFGPDPRLTVEIVRNFLRT